jgi:hypothetical protein
VPNLSFKALAAAIAIYLLVVMQDSHRLGYYIIDLTTLSAANVAIAHKCNIFTLNSDNTMEHIMLARQLCQYDITEA